MFFCCGGSKKSAQKKLAEDHPEIASNNDSYAVEQTRNSIEKQESIVITSEPHPPCPIDMDYQRAIEAQREAEVERMKAAIEGIPRMEPEKRPELPPLSLDCGDRTSESGDRASSFLLSPLSLRGPPSPRIDETPAQEEEVDDWAQVVLASVSRAGSTYEEEVNKKEESIKAASVDIKEGSIKDIESVKAEESITVEEPIVEESLKAESIKAESIKAEIDKADGIVSGSVQEEPVFIPVIEEPPTQEPVEERVQLSEERSKYTSLHISSAAAASFINFDATGTQGSQGQSTFDIVAPPTPDSTKSNEENRMSLISIPPLRSPSPAPSVCFSMYETDMNSKRASTLSTLSTIAAAAAIAALDRYSRAGTPDSFVNHRLSNISTYTTRASTPAADRAPSRLGQFSRPGSPIKISHPPQSPTSPTGRRVSVIPDPVPVVGDHPVVAPFVAPLISDLLPALDLQLSKTSILSQYTVWEAAMSLRREVRAFLASGVEEHLLIGDDGGVADVNEEKIKKVIDGFLQRGRKVQEGASTSSRNIDSGEGMGKAREFWRHSDARVKV